METMEEQLLEKIAEKDEEIKTLKLKVAQAEQTNAEMNEVQQDLLETLIEKEVI